ncbi:MAG: hypothetical protein M3Q72_14925 [Actinomycetota bacterium]|nr:hypothetical protein [Actinomycetota bacterium]
MTTALIIGAAALVVVVLVVMVVMSRRRSGGDTVAAFQRHIDALSPSARKPTVDRVQELDSERRADSKHSGDEEGRTDGS